MDVGVYFARIGIAFSILINVILGGSLGQTFSARNWDRKREGKPNIVFLIDFVCDYIIEPVVNFILTIFNKSDIKMSFANHCMNSWVQWKLRKKATSDYENRSEWKYYV